VAKQHHSKGKKHWPVCQATGKLRLRESRDAKFALAAAKAQRARARIDGVEATWNVTRAYECDLCSGGWHLTSQRTDYGLE